MTFGWRSADSPEQTGKENLVTDVVDGIYYYAAVLRAVEKGITDTLFDPSGTITRAQFATFLYRFAEASAEPTSSFDDVAEGAWYAETVTWAVAESVTKGITETLSSARPLPRGQSQQAQT